MNTLLIGGGSASGKTTLAQAVVAEVPSARLLAQDAFYRCRTVREPIEGSELDFDTPDAIEFDAMARAIDALRAGRAARIPVYDFATSTRTGWEEVAPAGLLVVEGTMVLSRHELRERADLSVFVDAPEALRRERRIARDVAERGWTAENVERELELRVFPAHARHVEPGRAHADVVLDAQALLSDLPGEVAKLLARL